MEQRATEAYKRSFSDSVGAGLGALAGSDKRFYILEHRTPSKYHYAGESQKIILNQVEMGRDSRCQIRFDDSFTTVSRNHAAIVRDGTGWKLVHLSKVNQTFLNGQEVRNQWYLENGDEIQLSANGPRLGFIIPQGEKSMIKNINFTERFGLFREQVLRPYRQLVTVLIIAFLIVTGGFVTWAVLENKRNDLFAAETREQAELMKQGISTTNQKIDESQQQAEDLRQRQEELSHQNSELKEQQQQATEQLRTAVAASGSRTAQSVSEIKDDIKENQKRIEADIKKIEKDLEAKRAAADTVKSTTTTATTTAATTAAATNQASTSAAATATATETESRIPSYNAYLPYIYYIQLNRIEIIDAKGAITTYNTTKTRWAGTGFLLNNKRFVTSRRVLEKWRFKENTVLYDLNKKAEDGFKVVAYFMAYSSSGATLSFTNEQFTYDKTGDAFDSRMKMHFAPAAGDKDWAYFNIPQDGNALKFNVTKSSNLDRGVNLTILGFPRETGYNSGLGPTYGSALTSNSGLDRGIIPAAGINFEAGGLGAPVFAPLSSGDLEVIGLISVQAASERRSVIIPISAVK